MLFVYSGGGRSGGIRMTGDRKFRFFAADQEHEEHDQDEKHMHKQTGDQLDHRQYLYFKDYLLQQITVFLKTPRDPV